MAQAVTHGKQTGKNDLSARPNRFGQTYKPYFLTGGLPGFTLPAMFLFLFSFPLFTDFSLKFFPNLPLLPFTSIFTPFSMPHQVVIFVLGAKVIPGFDGNARSSLLFSGKISSPAGSIFPKNLASPNPYLFKHPKRKRPMRQKDALKKNVG